MITPPATELISRENLVPAVEIASHLADAIAATARFQRGSTVTLTYKTEWDENTERLYVRAQVKSKRPVRPNRNEEVIEESDTIATFKEEIPGQERIPGAG